LKHSGHVGCCQVHTQEIEQLGSKHACETKDHEQGDASIGEIKTS